MFNLVGWGVDPNDMVEEYIKRVMQTDRRDAGQKIHDIETAIKQYRQWCKVTRQFVSRFGHNLEAAKRPIMAKPNVQYVAEFK